MHHLRPTALAGLLLALVPAAVTLSSCGFDYPTDRVNTIAGGQNNRDATVDALGIRVLATARGEGRLIGALANNLDEPASLDSVGSPEGEATAAAFEPIEVAGRAGVNLVNEAPIALTGDFTAGDFVRLELGFSTGETVTLNVPVVKACFQYTDLPTPTPATPTGSASESESAAESEAPVEGEAADEAADEGVAHGEGGDATFDCADEAPSPGAHE